jgi:DNA-binding MarR family transcriptional regulator
MSESGPEERQTTGHLIRSVRRLAVIAAERRAAALAGHGLDDSQLEVLEVLHAGGPPHRLTAGEVAQRCRVTPGAVSQRLAALERSGFIERVREEPDRRTVHVQLTASGQAKRDQVAGDVAAADDSMVAGLRAADLKALESLLDGWVRLRM